MGDLTKATSRDLADLLPEVQPHASAVLARMAARGLPVYVYETYRSPERQEYLKNQGKSQVEKDGAHSQRRALDLVDGRIVAGYLNLWGATAPEWALSADDVAARKAAASQYFEALGEEARREGFTWGGGWTSLYDPAHVEWPSGSLGKALGVVDSHPLTVLSLVTVIALALAILAIAALPRSGGKPDGKR